MESILRVLIVEDNDDDAQLTLAELRRNGFRVESAIVDTEAGLLVALDAGPWDLVIADYSVPGFGALAALRLVRERDFDLPVIVVSGTVGEEEAVATMRAGASDYVMKDHWLRLVPAIRRELEDLEARRQRRAAEQALELSEQRLRHANAVLTELARSRVFYSAHLEDACKQLTEAIANCLGIARVSVWLFTDDRAGLRCLDLYELEPARHSEGIVLRVEDTPEYFRGIERERVVAAHDAQHDPRTSEFADGYLIPLGITSMLDAATRLQGQLVGVVCFEHIGPPRQWLPDEMVLAGSAADLVSLALEAHERHRAEQALRESEERYRELFENANDAIFTLDLAGRLTSINRRGEILTGYDRDEILDRDIASLVAAEDGAAVDGFLLVESAHQGGRQIHTLELRRKDGRLVPVEISVRVIQEDGRPIGLQGIARDVSERQQLEAQLRQSQKMEAIGRLAGGIAHDFNNLLTSIIGYSDLALDLVPADDDLHEMLDEIHQAGKRAGVLTNQLLTFSRKQVLQPVVLDLNLAVAEVERMLGRLIGEDVALELALEPALGCVKADPGQIQQVIMNLAVNARDAMPQGGRLLIRTDQVDTGTWIGGPPLEVEPGRYVRLTVEDTGYGMDQATVSRIFEPFFTTKEKGKGTGLGLSTVFGIVKQSGGDITVETRLGRGTTFSILLPRVDQPATVEAHHAPSAGLLGGTETILLVEDESAVRALEREVLERVGYRVLVAEDGIAALEICRYHAGQIDLLLTDVVMPRMGGGELARQVESARPGIRTLFVSGYTDDALSNYGVLGGRIHLLQKPFASEALTRKVRELLDERPPERPIQPTGRSATS